MSNTAIPNFDLPNGWSNFHYFNGTFMAEWVRQRPSNLVSVDFLKLGTTDSARKDFY